MRRIDLSSLFGSFSASLLLLFLVPSAGFAQLSQSETFQLPNKQSRVVTFAGASPATEADVTRVRTAFRQLYDTSASMKTAVQSVGRNFTVNVVRSATTELGREDENAVFVDPGDLERAQEKIKVAAKAVVGSNVVDIPLAVQTQITQIVKDSLLFLVLAHETAGLAQPGHTHEGNNGILLKVKSILGELRAAETIKISQVDDCRSKNGVATIQLEASQVEIAPGRRVSGPVKILIEGNVNEGQGQFDGPCHVINKTFTVNSAVDEDDGLPGDGICDTGNATTGLTGLCTFRAAMTEADQTNALDEIVFDIAGDGVPKIRISTDTSFSHGSIGALRPVIIDGTTQPGGLVELDGSLASLQDAASRPIVGLDLVGEDMLVIGLVINGFPSHGIQIRPTGAPAGGKIIIEGNLIGTDVAGRAPLPNKGDGVNISNMPDNLVAFNLISGNGEAGIDVSTSGTTGAPFLARGNAVFGNSIGTDIDGGFLGNQGIGVSIAGDDSVKNLISQNAIGFNSGLEIDLSPAGATSNDAGDADNGANNLQNFPVLSLASSNGSIATIQGALNSLPNTTFVVDFFSSDSCDASGFGGSKLFLGSAAVVTDISGNGPFTASLPISSPLGKSLTATASDPDGNSSELSRCIEQSTQTSTIAALIIQVMNNSSLNQGQKNSLISKLDAAARSLDRGNHNSAAGQLNAFINEVQAMKKSRKLDSATADSWIAQAELILGTV